MSSACDNILEEAGFDKNDVQMVNQLSDEGLSPEMISKQVMEEIENKKFRNKSNVDSQVRTEAFLSSLEEIVKGKKPYARLFDLLVGDKSGVTSKALARSQGRSSFVSSLLKMPNGDIKRLMNNDKNFSSDFIKEMFDYNGTPKTKNKLAYDLADAVNKLQENQRLRVNEFGGGIYARSDYVTKQYHDAFRMLKAGKEKWVVDVQKHLDYEKTKAQILYNLKSKGVLIDEKKFNMERYLNKVYDQMTVKSSKDGLILDSLHVKRTLAFKDSDSLIRYNKTYGHNNMANAIFENMTMMDNHLSFGEAFGYGFRRKVKPNKVLEEQAQSRLGEAKTKGDLDEIADAEKTLDDLSTEAISPVEEMKNAILLLKDKKKITNGEFRRLRGALAQVSGDAYMVANPNVAKWTTGFQFIQMLSKLGKATLSSMSDMWTGAIILNYQGVKPGAAYLGMANHVLRKAFRQIGDKERDGLLRQLNVGVDGIFESYSRNFINNPTMGLLNEMTDKMFDWNLLNWWTNSSREGVAKMMSMHVASNLKHKFSDLPPVFKKLMEDYEFNAKDWDELRKIGAFDETLFNPKGSKKNKFITSDWIEENGGSIRLQENLNRYYTMESRLAVPEAGSAERAWMYGDAKRGSLPETTARLFFQFRTHQMKLIRNLLPRMYEMGIPSLMHVVPAIGLGYVSISLKNMVAGKEPPAFDNPETLTDALVQSGFAGFVGDFLGGQYGRYNHDWDDTLFGSAYATGWDFGKLAHGLSTGNKDASDAWKTLRYNIPYANLFYTEAAFNYGMHYGIMETFSPGYLNRIQSRQEGQDGGFFYDPTSIWTSGGSE